jgi:hypothetical protein
MAPFGGPLARRAFDAARRIAGDPNRDGRPFARIVGTEGMMLSTRGAWAEANLKLLEARRYALSPRDPQLVEFAEVVMAVNAYLRGDWEESVERFQVVYQAARARDSALHQGWGLYGQAQALVIPGRFVEARALLDLADPIIADQNERQSAIICAGVRAQIDWAQGAHYAALSNAKSALAIAKKLPCNNFTSIEGYAAGAEISLRLALDVSVQQEIRDDARRMVRPGLQALARYARTFKIGRPRNLLCRGLAARLAGNTTAARQTLSAGVSEAAVLAMTHERRKLEHALANT